jgi:hypothetical protein
MREEKQFHIHRSPNEVVYRQLLLFIYFYSYLDKITYHRPKVERVSTLGKFTILLGLRNPDRNWKGSDAAGRHLKNRNST